MSSRNLLDAMQTSGLLVERIEPGRLVRCRTEQDKPGQVSGWYLTYDNGSAGMVCVYGDWRTGTREVWHDNAGPVSAQQREAARLLMAEARKQQQRQQAQQWDANRNRLAAVWESAHPVTADNEGGRYLASRGLSVPNTDALRINAGMDYWHDKQRMGSYPVMLALVQDATGRGVTLHRTYLQPDGAGKADVPTAKKLMPAAGLLNGSAIRLFPAGPVLGVAEGIETSLSAAQLFNVPTWACVSASGLQSFNPPPEVREIVIFADNDSAGSLAAGKLAKRMAKTGRLVRITAPPAPGQDWNDVLQGGEHETV